MILIRKDRHQGRENCRYYSIGGSYSIVVGIERMFGAQFHDTHDERRYDYLIEVPGPVKRAPACSNQYLKYKRLCT